MKKNKSPFLKVRISMKVEGKATIRSKQRTYYSRCRETQAMSLDSFASIIYMYDRIFNSGSTYAYDGLMQWAEKKLPKKDDETAQSVFEKYWVNGGRFLRELVDKNMSQDSLSKLENDSIMFEIHGVIAWLLRDPGLHLQAFIYWMYKYGYNKDLNEFEKEANSTPDLIKEVVDKIVLKVKAETPQSK